MKVNLNLFYGMLKSNPPAFHILVTWMLKHNLTLLNIVEEEEFPSNLHVIYTRLQDTFKNQIPITQPGIIPTEPKCITEVKPEAKVTHKEIFEIVSIGEAIIFNIQTGKPCENIRRIHLDEYPGG